MCYCPTPTLHLNLALTGDGAFLFSLKKTHSVWFISVLNYGDTENVLINHLLLVIPMSYPCHYTNLCPHKPHKHAHTHTHTHTHSVQLVLYLFFRLLNTKTQPISEIVQLWSLDSLCHSILLATCPLPDRFVKFFVDWNFLIVSLMMEMGIFNALAVFLQTISNLWSSTIFFCILEL